MARPQIRPAIFIALQNGLAAALFAMLLAAELGRRLLHAHPNWEVLWWLSTLSARTVLPLLGLIERLLGTSDRLVLVLTAGVLIPLLSWRTRYWFGTALSGHVALGVLAVITLTIFQRGTLGLSWQDPAALLAVMTMPGAGIFFAVLTLLALVMCIADHVAFIRFLASLFGRLLRRR